VPHGWCSVMTMTMTMMMTMMTLYPCSNVPSNSVHNLHTLLHHTSQPNLLLAAVATELQMPLCFSFALRANILFAAEFTF
jgi:hypothetical protein